MRVYIRHETASKYYRAELTPARARRYDNGALISCGLSVPENISPTLVAAWVRSGIATEVTRDEWNHSGCQSSCVLRGQATCSW